MLGVGGQPAGSTPAGYGTPATGPARLGNVMRLPNGTMSSARLIDARTKDYVMDPETHRLLGMLPVRQIVQQAMTTDLGSAAVREMGNRLRGIDRITSNFEARCLSVLTDALQIAISRGLVEVIGFSTFKAGPKDGLQPGQTYGRMRWRDLTTGKEHAENV